MGCSIDVASGDGVVNGLVAEVVIAVSDPCPPMEFLLRHASHGLAGRHKPKAQAVSEKMVIALPVPLVIERHEEEGVSLELRQRGGAAVPGDGLA